MATKRSAGSVDDAASALATLIAGACAATERSGLIESLSKHLVQFAEAIAVSSVEGAESVGLAVEFAENVQLGNPQAAPLINDTDDRLPVIMAGTVAVSVPPGEAVHIEVGDTNKPAVLAVGRLAFMNVCGPPPSGGGGISCVKKPYLQSVTAKLALGVGDSMAAGGIRVQGDGTIA